MAPASPGMVVITYVREIAVSRRFYQLIGFLDQSGELGAGSQCAALRYGDCGLLLAAISRGSGPRSGLSMCLLVDDVEAVLAKLLANGFHDAAAGRQHEPGGQVSIVDPDGNTVLLSQRGRPDQLPPAGLPRAAPDRSLFDQAAGVVAARFGVPASCQVRDIDRRPCGEQAAVKLADSAGESVWACLDHVDEILVTVRGAFIASVEGQGLASFRARRRFDPKPR